MKTAEEKAADAEAEVTNCNKKILVMEQDLDLVTEKLNASITKVLSFYCHHSSVNSVAKLKIKILKILPNFPNFSRILVWLL